MACIYIVEDDTDIREIETIALRNSGHTVADFDSGRAFFHKVEEKVPDLALLDIMLPDMDGYAVCEHIKRDPRLCDIPVVFISYVDDPSQKTRGFEVGGVDYITKRSMTPRCWHACVRTS